jgi:hypothetical protein
MSFTWADGVVSNLYFRLKPSGPITIITNVNPDIEIYDESCTKFLVNHRGTVHNFTVDPDHLK